MTTDDILPVYIGYDTREHDAYQVCKASILKHATRPVFIQPISERSLRHSGLYRRNWRSENGQKIDAGDGKPFSTEFSFTRFLVPSLCQWQGWALFVDCDFLFMTDITELMKEFDNRFAAMCCKQNYLPKSAVKMDGQAQQKYHRKNWTSLIAWNNAHAANQRLTPFVVNREYGSYLHGLSWLEDAEIGNLDHRWNWIDGTTEGEPKAVHYTEGVPTMPGYEACAYSAPWWSEYKRLGLG